MNDTPLFSILIANYNDGKYLKDALASVERQTYQNYEVIIVDDCSTDNSKSILQSLEQNPIYHIYYNDQNRGCGYTKRKCVEMSNGDICGFLDADDVLTPDALDIMVESHIKHHDVSIVYSKYYACDNNLSTNYVSSHQCKIPEGSTFLDYKRGSISQFATFKRCKYNVTSGINEQLKIAEDLDLYFKLEEVGKTYFIDKPLYYYRNGTGNNTSLNENVIKAAYWEIIAKTDACKRRNVNIETIEIPCIEEIVNSIISVKGNQTKQTREYKLGNYILHPFLILKKIKYVFCK